MCTFGNGFEAVQTYGDTNYIYILLQFSMTMILLESIPRHLGVFYSMLWLLILNKIIVRPVECLMIKYVRHTEQFNTCLVSGFRASIRCINQILQTFRKLYFHLI